MMLESPQNVGYKTVAIKGPATYAKQLTKVRWGVVLALTSMSLCFMAEYLAHIPRERAQANLSYVQRVVYGGKLCLHMLAASLNAPELARNQSLLPLAEIYIGGDKVDALNAKLPDSGRVFQNASVKLTGEKNDSSKVFKAKVRYRGDSINHWAMPQKSWRIRLRKDRLFEGRDTFNLYLPRTSSQVADYLGYMMGAQMGLLTPKAYPVHFRLNRRFDGTRIFLEQVDENFLAVRGLDPWYIFVGDINTSQIYGGKERRFLFHAPHAWELLAPKIDRGAADSDMGERRVLHQLASVLNRDRSPYDFVNQIGKIVDVEDTLKYMALLDIVGSVHIDDNHNQKWYLNPRSGALTPIVWDTAAYMWGNSKPLSNPSNTLFRRMLQIPEFHARKNKLMWDAINGPLKTSALQSYVRKEATKLRADVAANPFKQTALSTELKFLSTEEWEEGVQQLLALIEERNNRIIDELSDSSISTWWKGDTRKRQLTIVPRGHASIRARELKVSLSEATSSTQVTLERQTGVPGTDKSKTIVFPGVVNLSEGYVSFALTEQWFPWATPRRMLKESASTATYQYLVKVTGPGALKDMRELTATSEITGARVPVAPTTDDAAVPPSMSNGWDSPAELRERENVVLRGVVTLAQDLLLEPNQDLTILPGTTVRLGPGVSIVLRGGSLQCKGTAEQPVVIEPDDPDRTWGVIALQGMNRETLPQSHLSHATVRGGSYGYREYAYYEASISAHYGALKVDNVLFDRARVAVKNGDLELKSTKFLTLHTQPVIAVNSRVNNDGPTVTKVSLVHPVGRVAGHGSGTAPREEREFRYRIFDRSYPNGTDSSVLQKDRIARIINEALRDAVQNGALWAAPGLSKTAYSVSPNFETSVYRDVYIDTPDRVNYRNNISYRLRNRFKDLRVHEQHLKHPRHPGFWPYRSEFQAKVGRVNPESGLTVVQEGRFEFRRQSKPFSAEFPPPPPPWPLADLLPHMLRGTFFGEVTSPGKLASEFLGATLPSDYGPVLFSPQVVVVTERRRQHLEIKTPWGTGPNPDQSFIMTLDSSRIFDSSEYLNAVDEGEQGRKVVLPKPRGQLFEMEMEFERNVSEGVARALQAALDAGNHEEAERMRKVQQAFFRDQETIAQVVRDALASHGVGFEPVNHSKFVQALDQLTSSNERNNVSSGTVQGQ